jgi:hypothetical protein
MGLYRVRVEVAGDGIRVMGYTGDDLFRVRVMVMVRVMVSGES